MGHVLYRLFPIGFVAGFVGGGILWFLGDPELGKKLILIGAICGLSAGITGVMMTQYKFLFSIAWFVLLGVMIARVTIWKELKPDSLETSALIMAIDKNWNLLLIGLIGYVVMYIITWGQRVDQAQVLRTSRPVYPEFPYERVPPPAQLPATGETIAQPVAEAAPPRESMMQRRERHMRIRRLLQQDRDSEAVRLLRKGEYIVGDSVESEYE
jgi:hypothetical protein